MNMNSYRLFTLALGFVALACFVAPRFANSPRIRMLFMGIAMLIFGINIGIEWANWAVLKMLDR